MSHISHEQNVVFIFWCLLRIETSIYSSATTAQPHNQCDLLINYLVRSKSGFLTVKTSTTVEQLNNFRYNVAEDAG